MKQFKRLFHWLPLLLVWALLASCTEEGDIGPQGPQGPPGNANVKTVLFTNQVFTFNPLANVYQVLVTAPDITADMVQKGSVQAFVAAANSNNTSWTALPGSFTPDFTKPSLERFFNFSYSSGGATIYTATNPGYNVDFKIVLVAGP